MSIDQMLRFPHRYQVYFGWENTFLVVFGCKGNEPAHQKVTIGLLAQVQDMRQ